jgi:hypothetical protein
VLDTTHQKNFGILDTRQLISPRRLVSNANVHKPCKPSRLRHLKRKFLEFIRENSKVVE